MLKPYCPYGCDTQINLHNLQLNEHTDITKEGVKVIVCHKCHKRMKVTTKLIPDYMCERVERGVWEKLKRWLPLSILDKWLGR